VGPNCNELEFICEVHKKKVGPNENTGRAKIPTKFHEPEINDD
jgi:hypothetical protein